MCMYSHRDVIAVEFLGSKIAWAIRKVGDRVTHLPNGSGYFRAKPFPALYPNISQT